MPQCGCTRMVTTIVMLNCVVILTLIALGPELIFHPLVTDTPAPAPQWGNAGHRYSLPAPDTSCPNRIKLEPFEHHPSVQQGCHWPPPLPSSIAPEPVIMLCQLHPTSGMHSNGVQSSGYSLNMYRSYQRAVIQSNIKVVKNGSYCWREQRRVLSSEPLVT